MMRRLALTLGLAIAGVVSAAGPAHAAYCAQPFDVTPLVKLTIATYPKISHSNNAIDASSIKIIDVNGTYGKSVVDTGSTRITFYWEKPTGTWQLASVNHPPAGWDKMIVSFFAGDDNCNNPAWKKHN